MRLYGDKWLKAHWLFLWMALCVVSCDSHMQDGTFAASYQNEIKVYDGSSYHVAYTVIDNYIYNDSVVRQRVGVIKGDRIYDDYPYWHSYYIYIIRDNNVYENSSSRLIYTIRDDKIYDGSSFKLEYSLKYPSPPYPYSQSIGIYKDDSDSSLVCSIRGGKVYIGNTNMLIYTIRGNKVYKKDSYSFADIEYTLSSSAIYYGETSSIAYTRKDHNIYKGRTDTVEYVWR